MIKQLLQWKSPAGAQARLSVLIFHRVLAQPDPLFPDEVDVRRFDALCQWVKHWFNVVPLDEAVQQLRNGALPARAACITFDDGYADNYHVAAPILLRHGLTATFFIATGFLDGGRMWNDTIVESVRKSKLPLLDLGALDLGRYHLDSLIGRQQAIQSLIRQIKYQPVQERVRVSDQLAEVSEVCPPVDLMMTSSQVKELHTLGMQIGAHTMSHPILAILGDDEATAEIQGSRTELERLIGERIGLFAYPNGKPGKDFTVGTAELVRRLGFDAAVSTQYGTTGRADDPFQIRRFTPWDRTKLRFGVRMLRNLSSK